jgi:two-component system osmolarity sensor histidine kinase EnvZ
MSFKWLKRYSPRGIYGRAALILIVPVVSILIIGSIIFVQRHYEDVTRQMTGSLSLDLALIIDRIDSASGVEAARTSARELSVPLALDLRLPVDPDVQGLQRKWYDFAAPTAFEVFSAALGPVTALDLQQSPTLAVLQLPTRFGIAEFTFSQTRIAASNPHQFLVLMVVVAGVMVLISIIFLRNQMRPIRRLARASEAFGKGQVLPFRPSGAAEVRSAGHAFLEMRARLERQMEQRTLMLSGVSHDLRTPLTRMKLELSLLDDQKAADALLNDVNDMERLLDSFLDFARADSLDDPALTNISEFVSQSVAKLDTDKRVRLVLPKEGVDAVVRPLALERALSNLVSNALRYGNRAQVTVQTNPRFLRIIIDDDGPGIHEDDREKALQPFVRLDQSRNQNMGSGVGLGLAITHDIARRHGGSLTLARSTELGGLRAEIRLPLTQ